MFEKNIQNVQKIFNIILYIFETFNMIYFERYDIYV